MAAQSIKEKFKSIKQDQISEGAKKALQLMQEATDNFKDADAVAKIRPKFDALYDKIKAAKPDAIRGLSQPKIVQPTTQVQRKAVTKAATTLSLSAKKRISEAKKERKSQKISTKKSDIEKDGSLKAIKKTGRRISQGLRANRYGSKADNKGHVYYEYRNNRYDKHPNSAPRLERGGMMAKGGGIYSSDSLYILKVYKDEKEVGEERFRARNIREAREFGEEYEDKYKAKFGGDLSFSVKEAMASGGMMSHGGETHRFEQKKKVRFDDGGMIDHDTYEVIIKSNNGVNQTMFYGSNIGEVFEDAMNSLEDNQEIVSIAKV